MGYLDPSVCWFCGQRKKNIMGRTRDGKDIKTPCESKLRKAFGWGRVHEFCLAKFIIRKVWRQEWTREYAQEYLDTRYSTGTDKRLKAMLQQAWELHVAEIERRKKEAGK